MSVAPADTGSGVDNISSIVVLSEEKDPSEQVWTKGRSADDGSTFWHCVQTGEKVTEEPTTGIIRDAHQFARRMTQKVIRANRSLKKVKEHVEANRQKEALKSDGIPLLNVKDFFDAWDSVDPHATELIDRVLAHDKCAIWIVKFLTILQALFAAFIPVVATLACRTAFFNPLEQSAVGEDLKKFCGGVLLLIMGMGYVYCIRSLLLNVLAERFNFRLEMPLRKAAETSDPPQTFDDMHDIGQQVRELGDCLFHKLPQAHYNLAAASFSLICMIIFFDAVTAICAVLAFFLVFVMIIVFEKFAMAHAEEDVMLEGKEELAWEAQDFEAAHKITAARNARAHSELLPKVLFSTLTQCIFMSTVVAAFYVGSRLAERKVVKSESAAVAVVFYYIFLMFNINSYHSHTIQASKLWVSGCRFNDDSNFHHSMKHIDAHLTQNDPKHKKRMVDAIKELKDSKGASRKMLFFLIMVFIGCSSFVVWYVADHGNPLSCQNTYFACTTKDNGKGEAAKCGDLEIIHAWSFDFGCSEAPSNNELLARCVNLCSLVYPQSVAQQTRRRLKKVPQRPNQPGEKSREGKSMSPTMTGDGKWPTRKPGSMTASTENFGPKPTMGKTPADALNAVFEKMNKPPPAELKQVEKEREERKEKESKTEEFSHMKSSILERWSYDDGAKQEMMEKSTAKSRDTDGDGVEEPPTDLEIIKSAIDNGYTEDEGEIEFGDKLKVNYESIQTDAALHDEKFTAQLTTRPLTKKDQDTPTVLKDDEDEAEAKEEHHDDSSQGCHENNECADDEYCASGYNKYGKPNEPGDGKGYCMHEDTCCSFPNDALHRQKPDYGSGNPWGKESGLDHEKSYTGCPKPCKPTWIHLEGCEDEEGENCERHFPGDPAYKSKGCGSGDRVGKHATVHSCRSHDDCNPEGDEIFYCAGDPKEECGGRCQYFTYCCDPGSEAKYYSYERDEDWKPGMDVSLLYCPKECKSNETKEDREKAAEKTYIDKESFDTKAPTPAPTTKAPTPAPSTKAPTPAPTKSKKKQFEIKMQPKVDKNKKAAFDPHRSAVSSEVEFVKERAIANNPNISEVSKLMYGPSEPSMNNPHDGTELKPTNKGKMPSDFFKGSMNLMQKGYEEIMMKMKGARGRAREEHSMGPKDHHRRLHPHDVKPDVDDFFNEKKEMAKQQRESNDGMPVGKFEPETVEFEKLAEPKNKPFKEEKEKELKFEGFYGGDDGKEKEDLPEKLQEKLEETAKLRSQEIENPMTYAHKDADSDGIEDEFDHDVHPGNPDHDSDGINDEGDLDDDNDGIFDEADRFDDVEEKEIMPKLKDGNGNDMHDTDKDGIPDVAEHDLHPSKPDTDSDGINDVYDDDDDNDGVEDKYDLDGDNDRIPDKAEHKYHPDEPDSDSDGWNDFYDDDDDNDEIDDFIDFEDNNDEKNPKPYNASKKIDNIVKDQTSEYEKEVKKGKHSDIPESFKTYGPSPDDERESDTPKFKKNIKDKDTRGAFEDMDGDGVVNWADADQDGDEVRDEADVDADADGLPDEWENLYENGTLDRAEDNKQNNTFYPDIIVDDLELNKDDDFDSDGLPDSVDSDADGDDVLDTEDRDVLDINGKIGGDGIPDDKEELISTNLQCKAYDNEEACIKHSKKCHWGYLPMAERDVCMTHNLEGKIDKEKRIMNEKKEMVVEMATEQHECYDKDHADCITDDLCSWTNATEVTFEGDRDDKDEVEKFTTSSSLGLWGEEVTPFKEGCFLSPYAIFELHDSGASKKDQKKKYEEEMTMCAAYDEEACAMSSWCEYGEVGSCKSIKGEKNHFCKHLPADECRNADFYGLCKWKPEVDEAFEEEEKAEYGFCRSQMSANEEITREDKLERRLGVIRPKKSWWVPQVIHNIFYPPRGRNFPINSHEYKHRRLMKLSELEAEIIKDVILFSGEIQINIEMV